MTKSEVNNPRLRDVPREVRRMGLDACYHWRELIGYLIPKYGIRAGKAQATRMKRYAHEQKLKEATP